MKSFQQHHIFLVLLSPILTVSASKQCLFSSITSKEIRFNRLHCPQTQQIILPDPKSTNLFSISAPVNFKDIRFTAKANCDHSLEVSEVAAVNTEFWAFKHEIAGDLTLTADIQREVCGDFLFENEVSAIDFSKIISTLTPGEQIGRIINSKHHNLVWTDIKANSLKGSIVSGGSDSTATASDAMAALVTIRNSLQYRQLTALSIRKIINNYLKQKRRGSGSSHKNMVIIETALIDWAEALEDRATSNVLGAASDQIRHQISRSSSRSSRVTSSTHIEPFKFADGFVQKIQADLVNNKWGFRKVGLLFDKNPSLSTLFKQLVDPDHEFTPIVGPLVPASDLASSSSDDEEKKVKFARLTKSASGSVPAPLPPPPSSVKTLRAGGAV